MKVMIFSVLLVLGLAVVGVKGRHMDLVDSVDLQEDTGEKIEREADLAPMDEGSMVEKFVRIAKRVSQQEKDFEKRGWWTCLLLNMTHGC